MDHIPLEIHMGLEIKGELPDKTHCTWLSTKCLKNRLNFWPDREGHRFDLWTFWDPLCILSFLEDCIASRSQLLSPLLWLHPHHACEWVFIARGTNLERMERRAGRGRVVGLSLSLPLLSFFSSCLSFNSFHLHLLFMLLACFPSHIFSPYSLKHRNGLQIVCHRAKFQRQWRCELPIILPFHLLNITYSMFQHRTIFPKIISFYRGMGKDACSSNKF